MKQTKPKKRSTETSIEEVVMDAIVSQRLAPSQKVSEAVFGDMFGISRSAARTLIEKLVVQQFLVSVSPRVTRVAPLTLLDVKQNFALRKMFFPDILAMVAPRIDHDELEKVNRQFADIDVIDDAKSALRVLKVNKKFNITILESADYPLLIHWGRQLEDTAMRIYWLFVKRHRALPFAPDQQTKIIDAMRSGDAGLIKELVLETLAHNEERILNAIFSDEKFYTQDLKI